MPPVARKNRMTQMDREEQERAAIRGDESHLRSSQPA